MSLRTSTYSLVCIWQSKHHSNASAHPAQAAPLRIAYWTSVLPVTPVRHIDSYTAKTAATVPIDTQINAVCCYSVTIEYLGKRQICSAGTGCLTRRIEDGLAGIPAVAGSPEIWTAKAS